MKTSSSVACAAVMVSLFIGAAPTQAGVVLLPKSVRFDARHSTQVFDQKTGRLTTYHNPIRPVAAVQGWRDPTRGEEKKIRGALRQTLGVKRLPARLLFAVKPESGKLHVRVTPAGQSLGQEVDCEGYYSPKSGLRMVDDLLRFGKQPYQRIVGGGATIGTINP